MATHEKHDLHELHVDELRERAKRADIPHAGTMRKEELIEVLGKGGGEHERGGSGHKTSQHESHAAHDEHRETRRTGADAND